MKSVLAVVLFPLFAIGVFVDGKETSNVKLESVTEGDSVTLKSGINDIKTDDEIEWSFKGIKIAKISRESSGISSDITNGRQTFGYRLNLNEQTGDLNISNIKNTDSGQYKLKVTSTRGSPEMTFTVNVVPADVSANAVKSVIVMEGDSVTLKTDIQTYGVIQWRFGHQKSLVAEFNQTAENTSDGPDGRFRDRLQQGNQSGSLTINNITSNHSGLYEAEISNTTSGYTIHHTQSFNVTVSDHVESVSVMVGDSVTLHTDFTEIQTDDTILWKFGDHGQLIVDLNSPVNMKSPNVRLINRTGNLMISNITSVQPGDYKVEINSRGTILHKKYNITIIDAVNSVSVKKGGSATLPTVIKIQNDDLIQWMFENIRLAEMHKATQEFYAYSGPDERFRNRLELDHQTGSLTIKISRTTDSGDYKLKISSSRYTINRTISVAVTGSDDRKGSDPDSGSGLSPGAATGIAFAVILGAAVLLLLFYNRKKIFNRTEHRSENGQNHKKQDTDDPNENAKLANNPETENSSSL